MVSPNKKNAPDAAVAKQDREEGKQFDSNIQEGGQTMSTVSTASDNFDALFALSVGRNRVFVQPASLANGDSIIELTDDHDTNLLLKPNEALAVAAALQAVATHVLEEESRFIRRRTEPGQPAFEETI